MGRMIWWGEVRKSAFPRLEGGILNIGPFEWSESPEKMIKNALLEMTLLRSAKSLRPSYSEVASPPLRIFR